MEGAYKVWMGQPVILRLMAGEMRVPLRGKLVAEKDGVLRLRVADSWDIDVFKSMVVGIEEDMPTCITS